jgi:hypothetical protein
MVFVGGPGYVRDFFANERVKAAQAMTFRKGDHVIFQIMKVLIHEW